MLREFVFVLGYIAAAAVSLNPNDGVFFAGALTALISFLVTVCALKIPFDMTNRGRELIYGSVFMFSFGIVTLFIAEPTLILVYSVFCCFLMCSFLTFDVQMISGGRTNELKAEHMFLGTVQIFLDVMLLFLNVLHTYQITKFLNEYGMLVEKGPAEGGPVPEELVAV